MKNLFLAVFLVVVICRVTVAGTATVSLFPVQDCYGQNGVSNPTGSFENLFLGTGNGSDTSQIYMQWNLSQFSNPDLIVNATLKMYRWQIQRTGVDAICWGAKILESWNENTLQNFRDPPWEVLIPAREWNGYMAIPGEILDQTTIGWIDWDATELTRWWIAHPSQNFGVSMVYVPFATQTLNHFHSSNYTGDPALRPVLEITYYTVPSNCSEIKTRGMLMDSDLNEDCHVNMSDMKLFADSWLQCNDPDGCN